MILFVIIIFSFFNSQVNNPKENTVEPENNLGLDEAFEKVLNDVQTLKERQEHLGSQLNSVKQANEVLKRELFFLSQIQGEVQPNLSKEVNDGAQLIIYFIRFLR